MSCISLRLDVWMFRNSQFYTIVETDHHGVRFRVLEWNVLGLKESGLKLEIDMSPNCISDSNLSIWYGSQSRLCSKCRFPTSLLIRLVLLSVVVIHRWRDREAAIRRLRSGKISSTFTSERVGTVWIAMDWTVTSVSCLTIAQTVGRLLTFSLRPNLTDHSNPWLCTEYNLNGKSLPSYTVSLFRITISSRIDVFVYQVTNYSIQT